MSDCLPPESKPLGDREREWVFRLLYACAFHEKSAAQLVHDVVHCFRLEDEEWEALEPVSPYVPNLRNGFISASMWDRIEQPVGRSLQGIQANQKRLELAVQQASKRWRLDRMAAVERSLLLLGAYELLVTRAAPAKRVINRTVELAKRYGDTDSRRFVNGILDQIRKDHQIPTKGGEGA